MRFTTQSLKCHDICNCCVSSWFVCFLLHIWCLYCTISPLMMICFQYIITDTVVGLATKPRSTTCLRGMSIYIYIVYVVYSLIIIRRVDMCVITCWFPVYLVSHMIAPYIRFARKYFAAQTLGHCTLTNYMLTERKSRQHGILKHSRYLYQPVVFVCVCVYHVQMWFERVSYRHLYATI